jgi:hypothetical protein
MNPLTYFKRTKILLLLIAPAIVAFATFTAAPAFATPPCGVQSENLAVGTFPNGLLRLFCNEFRQFGWFLKLDVHGDSDLYVTRHTFQPGENTGWHTHPGPSMIIVVQGTLTSYKGDDRTCTPEVHVAGTPSAVLTDIGCGDVHLVRNEGTDVAVDVAVQIVPAGQPRRIDVPDPGNCPVFPCLGF